MLPQHNNRAEHTCEIRMQGPPASALSRNYFSPTFVTVNGPSITMPVPEMSHCVLSRTIVTGPSRPEGSSGEFALYGFTSANVYCFAPGC